MAKAKIVIADDDQDIRDAVASILEGQDYEVTTAKNKDEAKEKIESVQPDLAVLDVMMDSHEDGFALSRELKGDPRFKDMPILLLTGVRQETGIDFKSTAGDPTWCPVEGFLEKPVDPDVLVAEVEKLLAAKA